MSNMFLVLLAWGLPNIEVTEIGSLELVGNQSNLSAFYLPRMLSTPKEGIVRQTVASCVEGMSTPIPRPFTLTA